MPEPGLSPAEIADEHRTDRRIGGFTLLVAAIAGLGGFLFGYDIGVISGAQLFIVPAFGLDNVHTEIMVAAVTFGAIFGAIFAAGYAERFGRRWSIILGGIIFVVGILLTALAPDYWVLVLGRVIIGYAVGHESAIVPMYIAEVSAPAVRGTLITMFQLAITAGIFVADLIDAAAQPHWRLMFILAVIPAAVLIIAMIPMPRSPRWLVKQGETEEAGKVLRKVREVQNVEEELGEIIDSVAIEIEAEAPWTDLFKKPVSKVFSLGLMLAIIQQLLGINTVFYYGPTILENAGISSSSNALWYALIFSGVNVAATFIAIRYIDRWGRRPLLIIGAGGQIVFLALTATMFLVFGDKPGGVAAYFVLVTLCGVVVFFAFSFGPIVWVMISEIFPLRVRATGVSLATAANWAANLIVALTFLSLLDALTAPGTFYLYAFIGILSLIYIWHKVPETKDKSLEELEVELGTAEPTLAGHTAHTTPGSPVPDESR